MIKNQLSALMGAERNTVSQLSDATGISRNSIRAIYYERVNGIKFDTLEKICRFYNCDVGDLLHLVDEQEELQGGQQEA